MHVEKTLKQFHHIYWFIIHGHCRYVVYCKHFKPWSSRVVVATRSVQSFGKILKCIWRVLFYRPTEGLPSKTIQVEFSISADEVVHQSLVLGGIKRKPNVPISQTTVFGSMST